MSVIHKLGDRVEKEHNQFLRDSQRLEDRSSTAVDGSGNKASVVGTVDFESLVGSANGAIKPDSTADGWDDVWGSIFTSAQVGALACT
jgi:SCY1-like protein 2